MFVEKTPVMYIYVLIYYIHNFNYRNVELDFKTDVRTILLVIISSSYILRVYILQYTKTYR